MKEINLQEVLNSDLNFEDEIEYYFLDATKGQLVLCIAHYNPALTPRNGGCFMEFVFDGVKEFERIPGTAIDYMRFKERLPWMQNPVFWLEEVLYESEKRIEILIGGGFGKIGFNFSGVARRTRIGIATGKTEEGMVVYSDVQSGVRFTENDPFLRQGGI